MELDFLVFGPHPDDAEIGAGGLLLKMKEKGYRTGIVDMTRGDMGWGTPEIRDEECEQAARILQLDVRENLDLGDCRVQDDFETRVKIAGLIRRHRPKVVISPYWELPPGRGLGHTDHIATARAVCHGVNFAHLRKMPAEGEPHQVHAQWFYFLAPGLRPTFSVDVTSVVERWRAALECHQSQFFNPDKPRVPGAPSNFMDWFEVYARRDAQVIGAKFAQSYYSAVPLKVADPMLLLQDIVPRL